MNPLPPGPKPDPRELPIFRVLLGDLRLVTWALGPYLGRRSLARAVCVARFGGKGRGLLWGLVCLGDQSHWPRVSQGCAVRPEQP